MTNFKPGDEIVVTNPVQPTAHQGGETGVIVDIGTVAGTTVVQIRDARDGSLTGVYPDEIRKR
ncbi:hypothetical protein ACIOUE_00950 [Streptomyces xanthochromogenes]|uniref:hypothetical protein n=1 Tax=Streptomyces xanthochromogenes TaxID=67384 RepID=UPI00381A7FA5